MVQWHACKKQAGDAILFFRLGDFYEAFHEDAALLAKELDLTLTKRQGTPMSGVPYHSSEAYIDRLVSKGYKVAIAEQTEDPKQTKGIVKREVVRVLTPGTVVNSSLISDKANNYIAAITQLNSIFGLSVLDVTTSEFRTVEFECLRSLTDELCRLAPKELLLSEKNSIKLHELLEELRHHFTFSKSVRPDWSFDHRSSLDFLLKHFKVLSLDGFGLKGSSAAIVASGSLLAYVADELSIDISHVKSIHPINLSQFMSIDRSTQRHLELTEPLYDGNKTNTLLNLLDSTKTPMGARLLKKWLSHPLLSKEAILKRQKGVSFFHDNMQPTNGLRNTLSQVRDIERLMMRISTGNASPRDLVSLRFSLETIPQILDTLSGDIAEIIKKNVLKLTNVDHLARKIETAIVEAPPMRLSDCGIICDGYNEELDELRTIKENSREWLANYQQTLRETHDIKTLKVGYTKAFGYYIDVSRMQSSKMPDHFVKRQTLVNNERFISPELKEFEEKVLSADEKIRHIEAALFNQLREEISTHNDTIMSIAEGIAHLDLLSNLGHIGKKYDFVSPSFNNEEKWEVIDGRHPVIEASMESGTFIPNDVRLSEDKERLLLITGPNMAGKSTYLRQTALISIMAQMGSFVPATSANLKLFDKVFSRIGASDDLSRGKSTFMVEMSETANILNNATDHSLVILDEIGRGTSTYDGISIAWSVAEYLLKTKGKRAMTLFATHYFELTKLEEEIPGAVNYNVAVHEGEEGIVFLHKILRGNADKSYGIHVAKLAGLPNDAIKTAKQILVKMESSEKSKPKKEPQLDLFESSNTAHKQKPNFGDKLKAELKDIDPNMLTPLQALEKIAEWKEKLSWKSPI